MKKRVPIMALALVLALAGVAGAVEPLPLIANYNLDATTATYCRQVGGAVVGQPKASLLPVTTSGSSTTITSVSSNAAFAPVDVGSILYFTIPQDSASLAVSAGPTTRVVTAKASSNSITVNSAIELPSTGVNFSYTTQECGTAATNGWFGLTSYDAATVQLQIDQISVTGGITYSLECGLLLGPDTGSIYTSDVVATANLTATGTTTIAVGEPYNVCRLGLAIGTNDNLDTITNGANDKIDFTEGALVCAADVAAGTYTGAGLATAVQTAMNTAGICTAAASPGNAYTVTFDEVAGTYTITSNAASTATFSILWNSGVNNATAADTILGYSADVSGATTYTGSAVTHDTVAEAEKVTVLVGRR